MGAFSIVHCAETIKGGIATYLRELLPLQLQAFGVGAVTVVIPASQRCQLPALDGVEVVTFDDSKGRVGNALALARAVAAEVKRTKPAVVHIHSTFAGATVRPWLAAQRYAGKVVYCPHGWAWDRPMSGWKRRLVSWIERLLARVTDQIVCISWHERQAAIGYGLDASKLALVLNGIALERPKAEPVAVSWPESRLKVLFVGRFDRQKGVDLLGQALELAGPQVSAVLAGDAVLADGAAIALPANSLKAGWVTPGQLETLFDQADLLVMPSRWEGFGLIAVEAMRAGLAVVASRVGGLAEVVEHGVSGILVPPDNAASLAEALRSLTPEQCRQMGEAGRQRFERLFVVSRVSSELAALYR